MGLLSWGCWHLLQHGLAAMDHQLTLDGVALAVLRIAALGGFGPSQARPQQAPVDGATLVALVGGSHQQALCWAALVTSVPLEY